MHRAVCLQRAVSELLSWRGRAQQMRTCGRRRRLRRRSWRSAHSRRSCMFASHTRRTSGMALCQVCSPNLLPYHNPWL